MKEAYEKLAVMVEAVDSEDVITTSTISFEMLCAEEEIDCEIG